MKLKKSVFVTALAAVSVLSLAAQQGKSSEISVEEFYLKESVPVMVIREQAQSEDREGKLIALDYIREAIESGDKSDEMRAVLQDLALEGILNKNRSEGRVANNYAEVRIRAVEYLGEIGTKEASEALVKVALVEEEPAVITAAFRSLTKIGSNEKGRTLDTANWIFNRFNAMNPDNRLALSYLEAIEIFIPKMQQTTDDEKRIYSDTLEKVRGISSNYKYITSVRDRAKSVLMTLAKSKR
ncbi:MAG: HEAT repeat domain-containing protein [Spirochaetaceae bacterium]|jgi:HEAT repeat protein|nr:HEAT repeat domain-containing protein [Spirochaetaceae bacterium]